MKNFSKLFFLIIFLFSCETEFEERFCPGLRDCVESSDSSFSWRTLFSDNFNRANSSLRSSSDWNHVEGAPANGDDFEILTNVAVPKRGAADPPPSVLYSSAVTNLAVRVSVTANITGVNFAGAPGDITLLARTQLGTSIDDGYFCGIDPTTGIVTIGKNVGGAGAPVAVSTANFTIANGDTFSLTFTLSNSSLTCSIVQNGTLTISATGTDSTYTTGFVGIQGGKSGLGDDELTFDNFLVEAGDP